MRYRARVTAAMIAQALDSVKLVVLKEQDMRVGNADLHEFTRIDPACCQFLSLHCPLPHFSELKCSGFGVK